MNSIEFSSSTDLKLYYGFYASVIIIFEPLKSCFKIARSLVSGHLAARAHRLALKFSYSRGQLQGTMIFNIMAAIVDSAIRAITSTWFTTSMVSGILFTAYEKGCCLLHCCLNICQHKIYEYNMLIMSERANWRVHANKHTHISTYITYSVSRVSSEAARLVIANPAGYSQKKVTVCGLRQYHHYET